MRFLAERLVFGGDDLGFMKKGVKNHLVAPMSPLKGPVDSIWTEFLWMATIPPIPRMVLIFF